MQTLEVTTYERVKSRAVTMHNIAHNANHLEAPTTLAPGKSPGINCTHAQVQSQIK